MRARIAPVVSRALLFAERAESAETPEQACFVVGGASASATHSSFATTRRKASPLGRLWPSGGSAENCSTRGVSTLEKPRASPSPTSPRRPAPRLRRESRRRECPRRAHPRRACHTFQGSCSARTAAPSSVTSRGTPLQHRHAVVVAARHPRLLKTARRARRPGRRGARPHAVNADFRSHSKGVVTARCHDAVLSRPRPA